MKRNIYYFAFAILYSIVYGQNLVLNPSFEQFTSCPQGPTEFRKCVNWHPVQADYNAAGDSCSSPDLFNACCTSPFPWFPPPVGVPHNILGHQHAHSGNGYAGIILREAMALFGCTVIPGTPTYREYIQGRLSQPLVAGQQYCVEFYISCAGNVKFATNQIGVYFSPTLVQYDFCAHPHPLPVTPQLEYSGPALLDTTNWVKLSWTYVASGGEQYFIIGNFKNDANTPLFDNKCNSMNPYAYYYIDDVYVGPCGTTDPLIANAGNNAAICPGQSVQIGGSPTASGGTPPYTYNWSPSTGLSATNVSNPAASPNSTTTYTVTVTDNTGQTATSSVTITVHNPPVVNLGSNVVICELEPYQLDAGAGFTSYSWSTGASTQTITVTSAGTYSVTVTDANNCSASASVQVSTVSQYDATITTSDPLCHNEGQVTLQAVHTTGGTWQGTGIINSSAGIFDTYVAGIGTHLVIHSIPGACGDIDSAYIMVVGCTELPEHIYVPNIFSPNQDGQNDILYVYGSGIAQIELIIYNRWGQKVFETTELQKGWDGTYNKKPCPPGVYYYILKYAFLNSTEQHTLYGNITLVR